MDGAGAGEKGQELYEQAKRGVYPGKRPTIDTTGLPDGAPAGTVAQDHVTHQADKAAEKVKPVFRQLLEEVRALRKEIKQLREDLLT